MGTMLWDIADRAWELERGLDENLPLYSSEGPQKFSLEDLQKSLCTRDLLKPYFVEIEAEGMSTGANRFTSARFVVTKLAPIARPDEDDTSDIEIRFYDLPDWIGEGVLVQYTPCGYRATNRLRFHFDPKSPTQLGDGFIQYIDHQPSW